MEASIEEDDSLGYGGLLIVRGARFGGVEREFFGFADLRICVLELALMGWVWRLVL